jgi:hypothetical protein
MIGTGDKKEQERSVLVLEIFDRDSPKWIPSPEPGPRSGDLAFKDSYRKGTPLRK